MVCFRASGVLLLYRISCDMDYRSDIVPNRNHSYPKVSQEEVIRALF